MTGKEDNDACVLHDKSLKLVLKSRSIVIAGEITKDVSRLFQEKILLLEALDFKKPIFVYIDSEGGDIDAGFAIFNMIRFVKPKVFTVGVGLVASAAALIFLAAKLENRFSLPFARYLLHQPLSGFKGVATDIEIYTNELNKVKKELNNIISKETGQKISKIEKDTDRDFWLDSSAAKKYGLVFEVVETKYQLEEFISA
ncbi:ATP-dependent Clp protease proteolytic subunit [Borreliella burgdorferi]|uniref:ATP-dependent Clp protease proteolytic subunit 2 n=3 Tax=Borreliella burgdorferi TaxID=139 RepID=CLPP2_BORBU|nr:ATP-dependent Clp protease proteolytic subunit [Borreliella burgdorferi]O51698.2 RecName: Full=ATP-dependent Clp protease proteolytic subunit 2; AltName: Full=Endopeptidase Clp 2 [Borreliella burgdorferi B31]AGS66753.1 ATP-dependent Clp protease proteolytic subunit [Borreliella burgdorferi CA382]AAC67097.2 Clp protease [Borreliella burgdorferi B31]ACK75010.1 Clp protease [Borreliella burgdorferi ZS7]ARS30493.1 ATP-dependent Clp protease proteolytic subunit [Borreliella burgdorferi]ARS31724